MKLNQLKSITHDSHVLQASQTIAACFFTRGTGVFVGVYDSSNGHWMQPTMNGFVEVGYLNIVENREISHVIEFNPS